MDSSCSTRTRSSATVNRLAWALSVVLISGTAIAEESLSSESAQMRLYDPVASGRAASNFLPSLAIDSNARTRHPDEGSRPRLEIDVPWSFPHEFHDGTSIGLGAAEVSLTSPAFRWKAANLQLTSVPRVEFANPEFTVDPDFVGDATELGAPMALEVEVGSLTFGQEMTLVTTEESTDWASSLQVSWDPIDSFAVGLETQALAGGRREVTEWSYELSVSLAVSANTELLLELEGRVDHRFSDESHDGFLSMRRRLNTKTHFFATLGYLADVEEDEGALLGYVGLSFDL